MLRSWSHRCTPPAGHGWDSEWENGVWSRGHVGPEWGLYVFVTAAEYDTAPGLLVYQVHVDQAENLTTA
ncbi:MAG: hypothetical protein M3O94_04905 [Actinomycetota bacterium]|jgi:hypothetical protein|nr:hypothetical protein [Actinomycetota bacterium]